MSLLLETIKVRNRRFYFLPEHSGRMNRSRRELFSCRDAIDLEEVLTIPPSVGEGLYKCRVLYDTEVKKIEFEPYTERQCGSLRLVRDDAIRYEHKYADRSRFDLLMKDAGADEIIIVKNGLLTDATYANIILFDGRKWYTPRHPLLKGIRRQLLLDRKVIHETDIAPIDIGRFRSIALINVMRPMDENRAVRTTSLLAFL